MAVAERTVPLGQREVLVSVQHLVKHFPIRGGIFSLVGESGCGKTTTARVLLRLEPATSGAVYFEGRDILKLTRAQMREVRRELQIIFQDPYASLNPRMTVGEIIAEPLVVHGVAKGAERGRRVRELLEVVGLSASYARRNPHEFSGGQRQRIGN